MTYWDYDDGSVGAWMDSHQDGIIAANSTQVLLQGLKHLIDAKEQAVKSHGKKRSKRCLSGILNVPMEGKWIDGRFCIRFERVKGFGISFSKPENFEPWLNAFLQAQRVQEAS